MCGFGAWVSGGLRQQVPHVDGRIGCGERRHCGFLSVADDGLKSLGRWVRIATDLQGTLGEIEDPVLRNTRASVELRLRSLVECHCRIRYFDDKFGRRWM